MATLAKILAERKARRVETRSVGIGGASNALGGKWAGSLSNRKGAVNELLAGAHLLSQGYDVFRNVSADGPADLVAINWNTGDRIAIDVKSNGFSVGSATGEETIARARDLGIAIMVVGNDGKVEWHNRATEPDDTIEEPHYESPDDYARSVS